MNPDYALRRLLALTYCPSHLLYMTGGELQDNRRAPCIDFLRDSPEDINGKMVCRRLAEARDQLGTESLPDLTARLTAQLDEQIAAKRAREGRPVKDRRQLGRETKGRRKGD